MTDMTWPIIMGLNAAIIIILAIIFTWKTYKDKKENITLQDERTAQINGKAAIGAFWTTYAYMLSILLWIIFGNEIMQLPEFEVGWTVISIMLVSAISYAAFKGYYNKKGETF